MALESLVQRPVWLAPMAGGVTTTALAVAVGNAGGLPMLAAGYLSAQEMLEQLTETRGRTEAPVGVNVFVPGPRTGGTEQLRRYAAKLAPVADRFGVGVGRPVHDDDDYSAKIDALVLAKPDLVTFTFGLPDAPSVKALRTSGIPVGVTVTNADEGRRAVESGADMLIAQAASAGGHRSVHDPLRTPGQETVADLLRVLTPLGVPIVVAGGIVDADSVRLALTAGAAAVSCGTAFLLADEAGTSGVHRQALQDPRFGATVVTRAFTGRPARALANAATRLGDGAPCGYPEVHWMTRDIRRAAARDCNPDWVHLWAGQRWQSIQPGPAASITAELLEGAR